MENTNKNELVPCLNRTATRVRRCIMFQRYTVNNNYAFMARLV